MLENIYSYFFKDNTESASENFNNIDETIKEEWIMVSNDDKISNNNDCIENYFFDTYMDDINDTNSYRYIDKMSSKIGNPVFQKKECIKEIARSYPININTKSPISKQVTLYFHLDPVNEIIDQSYIYHFLNKKNSQWSPVIKEPMYKMLKQIEWKDKYEDNQIDIILKDNVLMKHKVQIN